MKRSYNSRRKPKRRPRPSVMSKHQVLLKLQSRRQRQLRSVLLQNGLGHSRIKLAGMAMGTPGGFVAGIGYTIVWQDGPRVDETGRLLPPNGATLEDIFEVLLYRLETFEKSIYACGENKTAIAALRMGLKALRRRRMRRAEEGKLGRYLV